MQISQKQIHRDGSELIMSICVILYLCICVFLYVCKIVQCKQGRGDGRRIKMVRYTNSVISTYLTSYTISLQLSPMQIQYTNTAQIQHKCNTNTKQIQQKYNTNTPQIQHKYNSVISAYLILSPRESALI